MAVFLRTNIGEVHIIGRCFIEVDDGSCLAVDIVFFRAAAEVGNLVQFLPADGNVHRLTRYFCFDVCCLEVDNLTCSCRSCQRCNLQCIWLPAGNVLSDTQSIVGKGSMGYFEVLARLFPHVGALGLAVTVIIVIRCTPEVGLNAEAVF